VWLGAFPFDVDDPVVLLPVTVVAVLLVALNLRERCVLFCDVLVVSVSESVPSAIFQ
jgi:hypothetical protein